MWKAGWRELLSFIKLNFNSRRLSIVKKVESFINNHRKLMYAGNHRLVSRDIPYAIILRSIKWVNHDWKFAEKEKAALKGGRIFINDDQEVFNEVLKRSLVCSFESSRRNKRLYHKSGERRWANQLWKQTHGLNIYEIGNELFLFEFTLWITAKQVIKRDWKGRNTPDIL